MNAPACFFPFEQNIFMYSVLHISAFKKKHKTSQYNLEIFLNQCIKNIRIFIPQKHKCSTRLLSRNLTGFPLRGI